jgi:hypothetical protein
LPKVLDLDYSSLLKHNPKLQPGKMFIHHIIFETEGEDRYGYPLTSYDHNEDPIVKDVSQIEIPYLKDENLNFKYDLETEKIAFLDSCVFALSAYVPNKIGSHFEITVF